LKPNQALWAKPPATLFQGKQPVAKPVAKVTPAPVKVEPVVAKVTPAPVAVVTPTVVTPPPKNSTPIVPVPLQVKGAWAKNLLPEKQKVTNNESKKEENNNVLPVTPPVAKVTEPVAKEVEVPKPLPVKEEPKEAAKALPVIKEEPKVAKASPVIKEAPKTVTKKVIKGSPLDHALEQIKATTGLYSFSLFSQLF
jgi:cell pole-organizing protein PopZ